MCLNKMLFVMMRKTSRRIIYLGPGFFFGKVDAPSTLEAAARPHPKCTSIFLETKALELLEAIILALLFLLIIQSSFCSLIAITLQWPKNAYTSLAGRPSPIQRKTVITILALRKYFTTENIHDANMLVVG